MYDSVVNAFQQQSAFIKEDKMEIQRRAEEVLAKTINEEHPKVKEIIAKLQADHMEKIHTLKEEHIQERYEL